MLTETARFRLASERAVAKVIDGDAVVIDTITGRYYSLEGPGETAWSLLVAAASIGEVADALRARYEVDGADVVGDVSRLTEELVAENLLVPAETGAAGPAAPESDGTRVPYAPPTLTIFRDMQDLLAFDPPLPVADVGVWKRDP